MGAESAKTLMREDISFLLSNRIPHRLANRLFGWFSQIEAPLLTRASIAIWRLFADLDLSDARTQRFPSLHACFTRELKAGARPIDRDPHNLTSPCDAIVGACGRIERNELIQAKGFPYTTLFRSFAIRSGRDRRTAARSQSRLAPAAVPRFD